MVALRALFITPLTAASLWGRPPQAFLKNLHNKNVYRNDPENPNSLSHDAVWSFYESSHGTLWIGANDGLNKLGLETGAFSYYQRCSSNWPNEKPAWMPDSRKSAFLGSVEKEIRGLYYKLLYYLITVIFLKAVNFSVRIP